jgi:hypothetical protein
MKYIVLIYRTGHSNDRPRCPRRSRSRSTPTTKGSTRHPRHYDAADGSAGERNAAIEVVTRVPAAGYGGAVEIRPSEVYW